MNSNDVITLDRYQYIIWWLYIHENLNLTDTRTSLLELYPALSAEGGRIGYPSHRTLVRALNKWGIRKNNHILQTTHEMDCKLWFYFYNWALSDQEIIQFFQDDGIYISIKRYMFYI
jgi:hypothetical protein